MKKTLVSALTTALVVGAASTTFAAANPFEDVPADHWAYEAIAQLAADGVIDGYGDGTYRGDEEITRYEMAQMTARAMAKGSKANKALLDKLAAEFSEELNSLGVRVSNLEKKVDNVKFYGQLRYTYGRKDAKDDNGGRTTRKSNLDKIQLRLYTDAQVNKNWKVKAAVFHQGKMKTSENAGVGDNNGIDFEFANAIGTYGRTTIELGKFENYEVVTEGMVWNDYFSGVRVTTGKNLKVQLTAGRMMNDENMLIAPDAVIDQLTASSTVLGISFTGDIKKLKLGAGYYDMKNDTDWGAWTGKNRASIWMISAGYRFNKNFRIFATYAENTKGDRAVGYYGRKTNRRAYNIQLDYKGSDLNKPGSYGVHVAYKHLGHGVVLKTDYDYSDPDMKGFEIGGDVVLLKNVNLMLGYFEGKQVRNNQDARILFSRVKFFF